MTLLFVILLDVGVILVVSAFENTPLKQTFTDILNGSITPAASSADVTTATSGPTGPTQSNTQTLSVGTSAPNVRRTL